MLNGVDLGRSHATGIARDWTRLVRITDLVRTLESISVIRKEDPGLIRTVNYKQGESRRSSHYRIKLPVSQNGALGATPVASEALAFTKRQIVQDASRKAVV